MFTHSFDHPSSKKVAATWLVLSFNGGFINAGGFLATGRFVSHVTGFATLFGVDLVRVGWREALGILSVPVFFLAGAMIAGLLIDRRVIRNLAPHYDYVMAISSLALLVPPLLGFFHHVGVFGVNYEVSEVYVILASACLASGLQNAALSSSSGSSVRTTHMTGITTDLGLGIARLLSFRKSDPRTKKEMRANRLRFLTIVAFILGSTVGAKIFYEFHYKGFLIPAAILAFAAWHGHKAKPPG